mmetsp:Transcript_11355/g.22703  ORF Transcript_11355/g.22703 Transcript_11355/m.22703 type:complete len:321 (-) Transcript_11355:77-1039(-)
MPKKAQPPAGWTEEQETFIKQCVVDDPEKSWAETEGNSIIQTQECRDFASTRFYVHKRRSLSPMKPQSSSKMPKPSKSNVDTIERLAGSMKALSVDIPTYNTFQLTQGVNNRDGILLGLAENVKTHDGGTTSAAVLIHPLLAPTHFGHFKAKLCDGITKDKEPTMAIVAEYPSFLRCLKAKHGQDDTKPDETNMEAIVDGMKVFSSGESIQLTTGTLLTEVKAFGNTEKKLMVLPTPEELGAKPGNNKEDALTYHTGHFNEYDGALKPAQIKLAEKFAGIDCFRVVYGFAIAIKGTEKAYGIKSPTSGDASEAENFFKKS